MPDRLDADTVFLNIAGGQPLSEDPLGLAAFAPPRRAARGRERDLLFLCLTLRASTPQSIQPHRYTELLDLAAATFYGSPGSVTAALRQALAAVNQNLLDHNLRESAGAAPMQGGLVGAALRGGDFYAVQCGPGLLLPAHGAIVERFPALPSRPLGLSNALDAHYFHAAVNESEYFALSGGAHSGWDENALAGLGGLATLTHVVDRLKAATTEDIVALVGRFEPGGTLTPMKPAPAASPSTVKPVLAVPSVGLPKIDLSSLATRLRPPAEAEPVRAVEPQPRPDASARMPEPLSPPPIHSAPPSHPEAQPAVVSEAHPQAEAPAPELASASPIAHEPAPHASTPASETDWPSLLHRAERLGSAGPMPPLPVIEEIPPIRRNAAEAKPRGGVAAAAARAAFSRGVQSLGRA